MKLSAILATTRQGVIGNSGEMIWKFPRDLARFKEVTWGKPIIMGRKTLESLQRNGFHSGLPGRTNIVMSRSQRTWPANCPHAWSFNQAVDSARFTKSPEAFVIGGREVFDVALPRISTLYLTIVEQEFDGNESLSQEFLNDIRNLFGWRIRSHEIWAKSNTRKQPFDATHIVMDRV